ncbi:permease [Georgenia satyanarayanai]|uniref:FtsX-like permease family protein n=1 Tax=Georgenia satyanarayanai TaxID=860221 RepID=UPI00203B6D33|nr:FtsX-like permease family protein [Georgenia satyanarayanai]MCM3661890.1 permease [Georgenia satyanarayanai]
MRALVLLREALTMARSALVPTALVVTFVALMCAGTLTTVGRSAVTEAQVAQRMDGAGSRVVVIHDARNGELITPTVVDQTNRLSVTERAVGISQAFDVTHHTLGAGGPRVPAWQVTGELRHVAELAAGRWPSPGESLISTAAQEALGMDHPIGTVQAPATRSTLLETTYPVVGSFTPRAPFEDYTAGVLIAADPAEITDSLHVVATSASAAPSAQSLALALLAPPSLDAVTVQSPLSLAALQAEVAGDLTMFSRTLLLAVLGVGALLVAVVVFADVLVRRNDLGRRRALGATRTTIVLLVVSRTAIPALLGAAVGTLAGVLITQRLHAAPPGDFTAGTALLAILAAIISSVPPALYAAFRDPVRILRTP